jgi:hypothetical protein
VVLWIERGNRSRVSIPISTLYEYEVGRGMYGDEKVLLCLGHSLHVCLSGKP